MTLRFTWWGSDVRHKMTQKLIDAFEAKNPNIKIEGEYGEWSGYWDKLATQVASQQAPDVIQMDLQYLGEYAKRGALLDLKDVDLSKFDKAAADAGKTPEGQFAVTAGMNALVVLANPALVSASGVPCRMTSPGPGRTTRRRLRTSRPPARSASSRTKHPNEAQQFIDFLPNSVEAGGIALADRGIPGNTEVRDAITPKLSAADAATAAFINDIADEVGDAPVVPPAGSSPASEILTRFTTGVHFGRVSPEEAAKKSMEELKSALG